MHTVVVVGTCHEETKHYSTKALVEIIEAIRPSLILEELPEDWVVDNKWRKTTPGGGLEDTALIKYSTKHPECRIIPYDIKGRNDVLYKHEHKKNWKLFFTAIENLRKENKLSVEDLLLYKQTMDAYTLRDKGFYSDYPRVINSASCDYLMMYKNKVTMRYYKKIIEEYEELKPYKAHILFDERFWKVRTNAMDENILKILRNEKKNVRALVLCGFEHRNDLIPKLKKHQDEIVVKEYWEL